MLQVLVERKGFPEVEISEAHTGQRLTYRPPEKGLGPSAGVLEAHVWWAAEDLCRNDPEAHQALVDLVPLVDEVALMRAAPDGAREVIYRGQVVETGTDGVQVFVSVEKPMVVVEGDGSAAEPYRVPEELRRFTANVPGRSS